MSDATDLRRAYLDDLTAVSRPFRDEAFEYETLAREDADHTFRTLTYLNGGALLALVPAVTLLSGQVMAHRMLLVAGGACFVAALLLVLLARAFASFVMTRRSEAELHFAHEQILLLGAASYPTVVDPTYARHEAGETRARAIAKMNGSHRYRRCGTVTVWISILIFVLGCSLSVRALLV
jgi:hypothetical protein